MHFLLVSTSRGVWTVNSLDVIAVNTGRRTGGYIPATLILRDSTEITGMVLTVALERLEREIADRLLPRPGHDLLRFPWLRRWIKPPLA
jgi:hypothetical protein